MIKICICFVSVIMSSYVWGAADSSVTLYSPEAKAAFFAHVRKRKVYTVESVDRIECADDAQLKAASPCLMRDFIEGDDSVGVSHLLRVTGDAIGPIEHEYSYMGLAASKGRIDIAEILFQAGASLDADHEKRTYAPLEAAVKMRKERIVKWLVANGADVHSIGRSRHILFFAVGSEGANDASEAIFDFLLQSGARLDDPRLHGDETALHYAAARGTPHMIEVLLEHGFDPNAKTPNGKTPLCCAAGNRGKSVTILLNAGADPHISDVNGYAPMHHAAVKGNFRIFEQLLVHEMNYHDEGAWAGR